MAYAYDDNGNITSITRGSTSVTYQYNGANELIRENNQFTNQTVTYEYDSWGNIQNKKIYAYTTAAMPTNPTDTITYGYSTGEWKDQLVSYDGQPIVYNDDMGNPTTYRGKALEWDGKQLKKVSVNNSELASYIYDMNGLRTTKTVGNVTTNYFYNNTVLMGLTDSNSNALLFSYDANGLVQAVNYNGTYYYYLRNGQGDIVKLIDGTGATVVEYAYDSWGKLLSCTGTLATTLGALNPFRYRGYVYDEETQWYYLKSRYYDPETCRFISADVLLSTGQGVLGHNCYSYCLNDPVNMVDEWGNVAGYLNWVSTKDGGSAIVACLLAAAAVAVLLNNSTANKPINRPSAKKITIDMEHIISGHSDGGNRGGPDKDRFPEWMTPIAIERTVRYAYENADKIREMKLCWDEVDGEVIRQFLEGTCGNMRIQMWLNYTTKIIESAWPKY